MTGLRIHSPANCWQQGSRENVYLLTYSFNQDFSCFVCGTTAGFRVFALEDNAKSSTISEKLRREHSPGFQHSSVMLISMLFKSAIFAMVNQTLEPQGEPAPGCMNKAGRISQSLPVSRSLRPWQVQIWDERKQKVIAELRCRNEVKGVCLHKDAARPLFSEQQPCRGQCSDAKVIVMVCEYVIYVYTSGEHLKVILHLDSPSCLEDTPCTDQQVLFPKSAGHWLQQTWTLRRRCLQRPLAPVLPCSAARINAYG